MLPMTPLQSWALLILLLGTVVLVLWTLAAPVVQSQRQGSDLDEHDEDLQEDPAAVESVTPAVGRHLSLVPDLEDVVQPEEPYDWAVRGL